MRGYWATRGRTSSPIFAAAITWHRKDTPPDSTVEPQSRSDKEKQIEQPELEKEGKGEGKEVDETVAYEK